MNEYRSTIINEVGDSSWQYLKNDYRVMVLRTLGTILERSRLAACGGFVNTKLSLFSGSDFSADDAVRGPRVIYSWIQGRALESLSVHRKWLMSGKVGDAADKLASGCLEQIVKTLDVMEKIRAANNGRLLFMYDAGTARPLKLGDAGQPVELKFDQQMPATMSELFYVKGLAAAADSMNDPSLLKLACEWYGRIHDDIISEKFSNDQQPLDPKNVAAKPVPGRLSHGPRMIAIGAALRFLELTGDEKFLKFGLEYIDYILANHVNCGDRTATGELYDMWEFTSSDRKPYFDAAGCLLCDPGHATEFTGLAGKLLLIAKAKGLSRNIPRLNEYAEILPAVLAKNFKNGFSQGGYGMCKAFDLVSRKPLNTDMPWWPLPETMRSACLAAVYGSSLNIAACQDIFARCSNAFVRYFIRPDLHLMAYQTLSSDGRAVDVVPATPDADPGYHTNLSIIDCLDNWLA